MSDGCKTILNLIGDAQAIWDFDSKAAIPGMTARDISKAFSYLHNLNEAKHPSDLSRFPKGVLNPLPGGRWEWHKPAGYVIRWTWTQGGQAADVEIIKL